MTPPGAETDSGDVSSSPTLCFPDSRKSCFACCPPIRPAGYEHVAYRNILRRVLRENTSAFRKGCDAISPIRGFSCWALGYLDPACLQIGCLLHPARNDGADLRFRVDYGDKCRRESCPESREFLRLDPAERKCWLRLADGLDAFEYSSRAHNPLFTILAWGAEVLCFIPIEEGIPADTGNAFVEAFPFFSTKVNPRGNAYLLAGIMARKGGGPLKAASFRERFERFSRKVSEEAVRAAGPPRDDAPYTHRLPMDRHFLDFLRLSAGLRRIHQEQAEDTKRRVDRVLASFVADT